MPTKILSVIECHKFEDRFSFMHERFVAQGGVTVGKYDFDQSSRKGNVKITRRISTCVWNTTVWRNISFDIGHIYVIAQGI